MAGEHSNGSGPVTNRQMYELILDVHRQLTEVKVGLAGLPCHERGIAIEAITKGYKDADRELEAKINRRQWAWGGGGFVAAVMAIAAALGLKL